MKYHKPIFSTTQADINFLDLCWSIKDINGRTRTATRTLSAILVATCDNCFLGYSSSACLQNSLRFHAERIGLSQNKCTETLDITFFSIKHALLHEFKLITREVTGVIFCTSQCLLAFTKTRPFRNFVSFIRQFRQTKSIKSVKETKRQRVSKYVYLNNEAVLACLFSLVLKICFWLTTKVNSKMCPTPRQNGSQIFSWGTGADNKIFKMADVVCGFRVFLPSCCRALSGVRQLKTAAYLHKGNLFY